MSYLQTPQDLADRLENQLDLLDALCQSYDSGKSVVALSIATSVRVLVHDTPRSHSLLHQLGRKGELFLDTADEPRTPTPDTVNGSSFCGLIAVKWTAGESGFVPYLDEGLAGTGRLVPFDEYWNRVIIIDQAGREFSRKELILHLANKDGGAHIDPELEQKFVDLARNNSLGWMAGDDSDWNDIQGAELASARQIGHEILKTFRTTYVTPSLPLGDGFLIAGAGFHIEAVPSNSPAPPSVTNTRTKKVGRNDQCPCGSGKKFKFCHGRPQTANGSS